MKRALVKGFKFGILLQLAVGPVCLYIFNIGVNEDILNAKIGQDKLSLNEAGAFGSGMLLSDYIFLNVIAFIGCFTGTL